MTNWFDLIIILVWVVAGFIDLSKQKISRTDYLMVWLMLVTVLIFNYIGG